MRADDWKIWKLTLKISKMFVCHFIYFLGRFGRVIVVPKDQDDNMIRREIFQVLRHLDDLIQNATVSFEGESFTYKDACAKWENECFSNDILNLDFLMDDVSGLGSSIGL